jgi:hypothetical protein
MWKAGDSTVSRLMIGGAPDRAEPPPARDKTLATNHALDGPSLLVPGGWLGSAPVGPALLPNLTVLACCSLRVPALVRL